MDVSLIVVNYNTKDLAEKALATALAKTQGLSVQFIVVDNSSEPAQRISAFKGAAVFRVENKGFAHACNLGANHATGKALMFLNSDAFVEQGAVETLYHTLFSKEEIGAVGPKIVLSDGTLDHGCRRGFPTPWNAFCYLFGLAKLFKNQPERFDGYRLSYLPQDTWQEVDAISGACMMVKRTVFEAVGGFDERYFMYGEDLDLCFAIRQQHKKILYQPCAQVLHLKGQSGLHTKNKQVINAFYNAMKLFYTKNLSKRYGFLAKVFVFFGIEVQRFLRLLRHGLVKRKVS